jgi:ribonucleoside-diphosphate reductase subunit M2
MNDSPTKKIDFSAMDKENIPATSSPTSTKETLEAKKSTSQVTKPVETPKLIPSFKPQEVDEPLLQENPHRFVLFPIKYHEVRVPEH